MFEIDPYKKKVQKETGKSGVEAEFVKKVKYAGGKAYKFTSEMNRGVSDRLVVFPNQVWFVEIKRESTHLTPLQNEFKIFIESLNLNHYVIYGKQSISGFLDTIRQKALENLETKHKEVLNGNVKNDD